MRDLSILTLNPVAPLAASGVVAMAAGVAIIWLARRRLSPEELEKRRRLLVSRLGRTIEGVIVEADARTLFYTYNVHGVGYSAAQDISALLDTLEGDPARLVGSVSVKFLRANPANSIIVCEDWSGLPARALALQSEPIEE
jgi:hypothetical protein